MNEMVLAAHRLSKATGCHSDCISAAQSHIFAIKILAYSCDPWKCIPNIKILNYCRDMCKTVCQVRNILR
jgi:hypothetical protein